jgi:beta-N-acetylhexosaminidase
VGLAPLFQAVLAAVSPPAAPPPDEVAALTPRQKAALVIVSGLPAPRGVAGVIVRRWDRGAPRPKNTLVLVDQEGGAVRVFPGLPPERAAAEYWRRREAFAAGRATGRALRRAGVHVDLGPVLDLPDGPLGSRHFRSPPLGIAFARGLAGGGAAACVKHFPGLGGTPVSTDASPHVRGRLRARELAVFRRAIRAGVPCVMVGHAFYERLGGRRASFSRRVYRLLRSLGFEGVAVTDSLSVFGSEDAPLYARRAVLAGADLVLFTNGRDARRAMRELVPLARRGLLDERVRRVLALRRSLGIATSGGW